MIHILFRKNDFKFPFWCPYCDEVVEFGRQEWYDDIQCLKCERIFPPHDFPMGIDLKTGEVEP